MVTYSALSGEKIRLSGYVSFGTATDAEKKILSSFLSGGTGGDIKFFPFSADTEKRVRETFGKVRQPRGDCFAVFVGKEGAELHCATPISRLYALCTLRREYRDGIATGALYSVPKADVRCVKTFLPAKDKLSDFFEMIDLLVAFGFNKVMIELGGAMEYESHPEINKAWKEYCAFFDYSNKTTHVQYSRRYPKNSIHIDNGGGDFLSKATISELISYCRDRFVEIIPEVPCLSHADYLLVPHPELSETRFADADDPFPNVACPSNEDYYKLLFDILDEVVELFSPERVNICHDEIYMFCQCPECKKHSAEDLLVTDISRIHEHLALKGVKTEIWGEKLLDGLHCGEGDIAIREPHDGKTFVNINGKDMPVRYFSLKRDRDADELIKELPEDGYWRIQRTCGAIDRVPRDLEILNWSWSVVAEERGEDAYLSRGLMNFFGNFHGLNFCDFDRRIAKGVCGVCISNWGYADLETMQRNNILQNISYSSEMLWGERHNDADFKANLYRASEELHNYLRGDKYSDPHIEITSSTDVVIPHGNFVDGVIHIKEDYRLGDYRVEYEDGTCEMIPIYWGLNTGIRNVAYTRKVKDVYDGGLEYDTEKYVYEPIGISMPVEYPDGTYYRTVYPAEKTAVNVTLSLLPQYRGKVFLKDFKYVR